MKQLSSHSTLPPLTDQQIRRSTYTAALLALLLPPFVGGTLMGLIGYYPLPEFYLIFLSYATPYILVATTLVLLLTARAARYITALPLQDPHLAAAKATQIFKRLPWLLLGGITLYSIGGALSADFSIEQLGYRNYTLRDHLFNQFGLIPVVLISAFLIFFYYIDQLGRYLGPRRLHINAIPLWMKLLMLGIVTPLLIDSLIIGYYLNRTGYFEWQTLVLWLSLLALAAGGTWIAWKSIQQGLTPLQSFIASSPANIIEQAKLQLVPQSLDELGVLTARYAELLSNTQQLSGELQRSQNLADAIIENAGAIVLLLNREGRVVRFNRTAERLSGYSAEEIIGKFPWDTFLPPDEVDGVRRFAFDALANNPQALTGNFTNNWRCKDGRLLLTEWNNTLLLDSAGNMEFMISVGHDITARHKSEEKLRDNEERLRLALMSANQGLYDLNVQTGEAIVSPEYATMLGYDPAEFHETNAAWRQRLHPDDQALVYQAYTDYVAGRTSNYRVEFRQRTKQGEWIWILSIGKLVSHDATGNPLRMLGTHTNITERKRIEQSLLNREAWLRHTQSIAHVGSWELDLIHDHLNWSEETFRIFDIQPSQFGANYLAFRQAVHPDDRETVDAAYNQSIKNKTLYNFTHRIQLRDGSIKHLQERGETFYDEQGNPTRTIGAVLDITQHVLLESQARHHRDRLQFIIDASPDWIYAKDLQHRFVMVNKAFANAQGLPPDKMIGHSDTEFWSAELCEGNPANNIRGFHDDDRRAFQGDYTHNPHDPATFADDSLHIFDTIKGPLRNDKGEIIGVFSYSRDMTPRIEAEERYQSVVATMTEGVVIQQADGQIIDANRAAETILGLTIDQMRGRTAMDPRWQAVREDGSAFPGEEHPGNVALRTSQTFDGVIMGVDHPGKGRRWISINAFPLMLTNTSRPYGSVASFTDITERKHYEETLLTTNQIISAVLDTTPVLIAYLDPQMNFIRVNKAYAEADHKTPDFFPGKNHFALFPHAENEAIFRQVAKTGVAYTATAKPFEYEHNKERGVSHWDWTLTPIKNNRGTVTGLVLSLMNVTERISALENLRLNEEKLQRLNASLEAHVRERTRELQNAQRIAKIGNWSRNLRTNDVSWSDEIYRIFGYEPSKTLPSVDLFEVRIHPEDQTTVHHFVQKVISDKSSRGIDYRIRREDNTILWVHSEITLTTDDTGKPLALTGTLQDITERKEYEFKLSQNAARLDNAQHIARMGDYIFNLQTGDLYWSDMCYELLGFTPGTITPTPELFVERIHPDDKEHVKLMLVTAFNGNYSDKSNQHITLPKLEYRIIHTSGSLFWLQSIAYAETDINGKLLTIRGTVHDITALKNTEADLRQANDAKNTFLSRMSHELRTPMNAILGFSQVLDLEPLTAEQKDFVQEINRAGTHLLELINELLDLSRIESGKLAIVLQPVNVQKACTDAIQLVMSTATAKQITIRNECHSDVSIMSDSTRLKQILVNFLSNAIKYNHAGGQVILSCIKQRDSKLRLAVTDTGPGIAPEKHKYLFTPFERLGAEFTAIDGTGIGLALCKKLVELMQGEIGIVSAPGQGSTFWIEFNLIENFPEVTTRIDTKENSSNDLNQLALYIEDNAANLKVVEAMLRQHIGTTLLTANNGEFGLELANRYQPNVILLDIHLPGMDGYAVLTALQNDPRTKHIPVIALSADAMPLDIERGLHAGFKQYLTKPIKLDELLSVLEQTIHFNKP